MKDISEELKSHLAGEVTTIATCWKLTRTDASVLGFTNYSSDILFDDVSYVAAGGFNASAVQSSAGFAVDNLDVDSVLTSEFISEDDLRSGLYDYAAVEVFLVNYSDLSQGRLIIKAGWLGEVSYTGTQFTAEVRGITQKLGQKIGSIYSPQCSATFGDAKCKKNVADFKFSGTVLSVTDTQKFKPAGLVKESGYFDYGRIKFTSGANSGLEMEVKEYVKEQYVQLALPMPFVIAVGDGFEVIAGCDKSFGTCTAKFANALNFRGHPHLPGLDKILETAGTRSS